MCRSTNRRSEPEVWIRIIYIAQETNGGAPTASYREQVVEIALGPKGAFEGGSIGVLTRRVSATRVTRARPDLATSKPPREPRTPRVVELLNKAVEWRRQLDVGEVRDQADIARREGITRARVTQVMGLLRLAPGIQKYILSLPDAIRRGAITEQRLRAIKTISGHHDPLRAFRTLAS